MHYIQIPIGNMPVNLVLFGNRSLMFIPVAGFEAILDMPEKDKAVSAFFYPDGFSLMCGEECEDFDYKIHYAYYQIPMMLEWLQQQNLNLPKNIQFTF